MTFCEIETPTGSLIEFSAVSPTTGVLSDAFDKIGEIGSRLVIFDIQFCRITSLNFWLVVSETRIMDHVIRERFPPPVVTITRFIMTSIVS